ncbi:hypothetical protein Tco_0898532, partial [Tanacetum coccineum]
LSCLLKEQLLEPALNLTVHCCGLEFRVLNGYDQKSFDEERGLICCDQTTQKFLHKITQPLEIARHVLCASGVNNGQSARELEDDGTMDKLDPKEFDIFKTLVILETMSIVGLILVDTSSFLILGIHIFLVLRGFYVHVYPDGHL